MVLLKELPGDVVAAPGGSIVFMPEICEQTLPVHVGNYRGNSNMQWDIAGLEGMPFGIFATGDTLNLAPLDSGSNLASSGKRKQVSLHSGRESTGSKTNVGEIRMSCGWPRRHQGARDACLCDP